MKYVVTGSLGHISKPLTEKLVKEKHDVTVISSSDSKQAEIEALGAKAAIGSIEDVDFLTRTFTGTDAVYTMVPPNWSAADWKGYIKNVGKNYAAAIKAAEVKKVVNLSSVGAHMPEGCGPVSGSYYVEQELNALEGVDVLHLRPVYFYYNLLSNIGLIKGAGIIGGNYGENTVIPMVHVKDIAAVATEALLQPSFTGKTIRYIAGDEVSTTDTAKILGEAIGKPELPWVDFTDEQSVNGMLGAGLPKEIADNLVEMGAAMRSGAMFEEYFKNKPAFSPIKLKDYAKEFAAAFEQK